MPSQFYTLVLLLSLSIQSQAQNFIDNISITGGFLFDEHDFYDEQSDELQELNTKSNYKGFNYLSLGFNGQKADRVYGLELEFSGFEIIPEPRYRIGVLPEHEILIPDLHRIKIQGNAIVYYGKEIVNKKRYHLIAAPMASLSYFWKKDTPIPYTHNNDLLFPQTRQTISIGLGIKIQNQFWISEKIGFGLGTRFFLLDTYMEYLHNQNPILSLREQFEGGRLGVDLIRNELLLQLGIHFKL